MARTTSHALHSARTYAQAWQALMQPFADLRFKDARFKHGTEGGIGKGCGERGALHPGMNLQYGAVQLNPDDIVVLSSDGLGDVLDPLAARVPPRQFDLPHSVRVFPAARLRLSRLVPCVKAAARVLGVWWWMRGWRVVAGT